jgi:hypothetical protein
MNTSPLQWRRKRVLHKHTPLSWRLYEYKSSSVERGVFVEHTLASPLSGHTDSQKAPHPVEQMDESP